MNFRKIVFWSVVFVIIIFVIAASISFIKLPTKNDTDQSSPITELPVPPLPTASPDKLCIVGTDPRCPLCHTSPMVSDETHTSDRGEDYTFYTNERDGYSLEIPAHELTIEGVDLHPYPFGGFWSAGLGYNGSLGEFGRIAIICGNMETAMKTSFEARGWRESAVHTEHLTVGENKMNAVFIKSIGENPSGGKDPLVSKSVFVEKSNGTTLLFDGPSLNEGEMQLFDDMISSIRLLD